MTPGVWQIPIHQTIPIRNYSMAKELTTYPYRYILDTDRLINFPIFIYQCLIKSAIGKNSWPPVVPDLFYTVVQCKQPTVSIRIQQYSKITVIEYLFSVGSNAVVLLCFYVNSCKLVVVLLTNILFPSCWIYELLTNIVVTAPSTGKRISDRGTGRQGGQYPF